MYHADPVCAADGKYVVQLLRAVAEPAGGDHDGAGGDRIVTDGHADDRAGLGEQPVDALAERDVDLGLPAVPGQDVDHGLAATDRDVDPAAPVPRHRRPACRRTRRPGRPPTPPSGRPARRTGARRRRRRSSGSVAGSRGTANRGRRRSPAPSGTSFLRPSSSPPDSREEPPTTPSLSATRTLAAPRSRAVSGGGQTGDARADDDHLDVTLLRPSLSSCVTRAINPPSTTISAPFT